MARLGTTSEVADVLPNFGCEFENHPPTVALAIAADVVHTRGRGRGDQHGLPGERTGVDTADILLERNRGSVGLNLTQYEQRERRKKDGCAYRNDLRDISPVKEPIAASRSLASLELGRR